MRRRTIVGLIVLLLFALTLGLFVRSCLHSRRVAEKMSAQLQTLYGGDVNVDGVDIGVTSTTMTGLTLYEEGTEPDAKIAWLKVGTLTADVSLWGLLNGDAMPKRLTIRGAALLLRFDADGALLTSFPRKNMPTAEKALAGADVPEIVVENSDVILRKEGHPELAVRNVSVRLTHEKGRLVFEGSAKHADLGTLLVQGALDTEFKAATATLKNEAKSHVTQKLLESIPLVPRAVWQEIRIVESDATAALTLRYDVPRNEWRYRVELAAENSKVVVPALETSAHAARGKVVIEDDLVQLRAIEAKAFDGAIRFDADLDFRGQAIQLSFPRVNVEDLKVSDLPDDWNIPPLVRRSVAQGRLTGDAKLTMIIIPRNYSSGDVAGLLALWTPAPWLTPASFTSGFVGNEMIMKTQGKATVRDPAGKQEPIEFDWTLTPRPVRSASRAP